MIYVYGFLAILVIVLVLWAAYGFLIQREREKPVQSPRIMYVKTTSTGREIYIRSSGPGSYFIEIVDLHGNSSVVPGVYKNLDEVKNVAREVNI